MHQLRYATILRLLGCCRLELRDFGLQRLDLGESRNGIIAPLLDDVLLRPAALLQLILYLLQRSKELPDTLLGRVTFQREHLEVLGQAIEADASLGHPIDFFRKRLNVLGCGLDRPARYLSSPLHAIE